jgi:glycine/D-amino acid oxidase-like deaminating enzyme
VKRLFDAFAYGEGPRTGCWWDETCKMPVRPSIAKGIQTDVAIIGAGFTGISAALHLAKSGISVTVLEAERVGWRASGRNGGFCCLGGGRAGDALLDRRFGRAERIAFHRAELAAVRLVEALIKEHGIDVDRHSQGETMLAHRPKDMDALRAYAGTVDENYGVGHTLHSAQELVALGMAGPFHGGLSVEAGFGLNPRKYLAGLAQAAEAAGARIYERSSVAEVVSQVDGWMLRANGHRIRADHVIIATNGYSSDDLPDWLAGRYLPSQSNVIVTRPLEEHELASAGWTTDQMAYDTRNLVHYFRLMPDRRFLFGMRGGLLTGPAAEARARAKARSDFEMMFPAWRRVETKHSWSGMVCLARDMVPFVGPVPAHSGLWAGLCYHGNGVAMGSYSGALLAQLIQAQRPSIPYPAALKAPLRRFRLGPLRRAMMPLGYGAYMLADL